MPNLSQSCTAPRAVSSPHPDQYQHTLARTRVAQRRIVLGHPSSDTGQQVWVIRVGRAEGCMHANLSQTPECHTRKLKPNVLQTDESMPSGG